MQIANLKILLKKQSCKANIIINRYSCAKKFAYKLNSLFAHFDIIFFSFE